MVFRLARVTASRNIMSSAQIPVDLYPIIFKYVFEQDSLGSPVYENKGGVVGDYRRRARLYASKLIKPLLLVNKRWNQVSVRYLYENPTLFSDVSGALLLATLQKSIRAETYWPYHELIKKLEIEDLTEKLVLGLVRYCTKLSNLYLVGHGAAIQLNFGFMQQMLALETFKGLKTLACGSSSDPLTSKGFKRLLVNQKDAFLNLEYIQICCPQWLDFEGLKLLLNACPRLIGCRLEGGEPRWLFFLPTHLSELSLDLQMFKLDLRLLDRFETLTSLSLYSTKFNSRGLQHISLPALAILSLRRCCILDYSPENISVFASNCSKKLRELTLFLVSDTTDVSVIDDFVRSIGPQAKDLRYLDLGNQIPMHFVADIAVAVNLEILIYGNLHADFFVNADDECSLATDLVFLVNNMPNLRYIHFDPIFYTELYRCLFDDQFSEFEQLALLGPSISNFQYSGSDVLLPNEILSVKRIKSMLIHFPSLLNSDWNILNLELENLRESYESYDSTVSG